MTEQELKKIIKNLKKSSLALKKEDKRHLEKIKKIEEWDKKIHEELKQILTQDNIEWIYWFVFETDCGKDKRLKAWDKDGKPICRNFKELLKIINE